MMKLAMTTFRSDQKPTIFLYELNDFFDLHIGSNENCISLCYDFSKTANESRFNWRSSESMPAGAAKERSVITDKVVLPKTGKTIAEWFDILDQKGAKKLDAHGIYALINNIEGLKPLGEWNCGLLSTTYQWDRGLRQRGEKADGFEISVSKTIAVPIGELYTAWADDVLRAEWLMEKDISITKATENKSIRILWSDKKTRLSVDFYAKGDAKSQVVVQHLKLPDSKKATEMKEYWCRVLDNLKSTLENI